MAPAMKLALPIALQGNPQQALHTPCAIAKLPTHPARVPAAAHVSPVTPLAGTQANHPAEEAAIKTILAHLLPADDATLEQTPTLLPILTL